MVLHSSLSYSEELLLRDLLDRYIMCLSCVYHVFIMYLSCVYHVFIIFALHDIDFHHEMTFCHDFQ